jgi:hypothetical protein
MIRSVKLVWFVSFLPFVVLLLITYMQMADFQYVTLLRDEAGQPVYPLSTGTYFYLMVFLCGFANALMITLTNVSPALPPSFYMILPQKKVWFGSVEAKRIFDFNLIKWLQGFAAIINFFLCLVIVVIYYQNTNSALEYLWIGKYMIILMTVGWLVFYYMLFSKKPSQLNDPTL